MGGDTLCATIIRRFFVDPSENLSWKDVLYCILEIAGRGALSAVLFWFGCPLMAISVIQHLGGVLWKYRRFIGREISAGVKTAANWAHGVLESTKRVARKRWDEVRGVWRKTKRLARREWNSIKPVIQQVWDGTRGAWRKTKRLASRACRSAVQQPRETIGKIVGGASDLVRGVWNSTKSLVSRAWSWLTS
ncbi:hypothetical protein C8R46DRAFT_438276 [Mycena filopes]|nr:hypothetical protein C8R46DRAFT_438276 [Mycena filopes]